MAIHELGVTVRTGPVHIGMVIMLTVERRTIPRTVDSNQVGPSPPGAALAAALFFFAPGKIGLDAARPDDETISGLRESTAARAPHNEIRYMDDFRRRFGIGRDHYPPADAGQGAAEY